MWGIVFEVNTTEMMKSVDAVQKQLAKVPPYLLPTCQMAAANYILNVLIKQEIPPPKRVTRRSVYGVPFASDKQRRWFFWALSNGIIDVPYRRRGKNSGIQSKWHINQKGGSIPIDGGSVANPAGYQVILANDDPGAKYVYGDDTQNKLIGRIGWKKITVIVEERSKQLSGVVLRAANSALKKVIKKS